jgi:transposase-like protein
MPRKSAATALTWQPSGKRLVKTRRRYTLETKLRILDELKTKSFCEVHDLTGISKRTMEKWAVQMRNATTHNIKALSLSKGPNEILPDTEV